jgi:hypothetical protein
VPREGRTGAAGLVGRREAGSRAQPEVFAAGLARREHEREAASCSAREPRRIASQCLGK